MAAINMKISVKRARENSSLSESHVLTLHIFQLILQRRAKLAHCKWAMNRHLLGMKFAFDIRILFNSESSLALSSRSLHCLYKFHLSID